MAEAVICECCGEVKRAKDMVHVRTHRLASATEHYNSTEDYFDVCKVCYAKIEALLVNKEKKK